MRYLTICISLLLLACSSSQQTLQVPVPHNEQQENETDSDLPPENPQNRESDNSEYPYLSSLSDVYYNRTNNIPIEYERLKKEIVEEEKDLFEGYRVQIFSGQNVALADTAAKRFRAWSAEHIEGYQAETYTFFKAPYYRVHVGDFHDRQRAIEFSNLLKRQFRDSWVVYDRVNPWNVPADTVRITFKN